MSDKFFIRETKYSPEFNFDKQKGIFKISGKSYSEDAVEIYTKAIEWLKEYFESPNEQTVFDIDIDYMNSTSVLQIAILMKLLKDNVEKGKKIFVNWYYDELGEDIKEQGEDISELFGLEVNLIEKKKG